MPRGPSRSNNLSAGVRQKIQTANIISRLQKHVDGQVEMSPTQVRAAEILLQKVVPNLASIESFNHTEMSVISAEPLNEQAWAQAHTQDEDHMGEAQGSA